MRTQTMVQLTADLVQRLDELAERDGVSRSKLIRQAVEQMLDAQSEDVRIRDFIAAYSDAPETDDEMLAATQAARALIQDESW